MGTINKALMAMELTMARYNLMVGRKVHIALSQPKQMVLNNKKDLPKGYSYAPIWKISENDIFKLHKLISNNDPFKNKFLDSLYNKYKVNNLTHRICVKDGEIEKIDK